MRNLRWAVSAALAVVASVVIAACGSSSTTSATGGSAGATNTSAVALGAPSVDGKPPYASEVVTGPNPAQGNKTIGLVEPTASLEFFTRLNTALESAASRLGWNVKVANVNGNLGNVPGAIQNLVQAGADAVVLEAIDPALAGAGAGYAKARNVPILGDLTGVPASRSGGVLLASFEQPLAHEMKGLANVVASEVGSGSQVALITDKDEKVGSIPGAALQAALKGRLDVVATHQANLANAVPDAYSTVQQWLVQYPNLKGLWCVYDALCLGAVQAIQGANRPDVHVYGIDGNSSTMKLIREGFPWVSLAAPVEYAAWLTLDTINAYWGKRPYKTDNIIHDQLTDKSNVPASGVVTGTTLYGDFTAAFSKRWEVNGG